MPHSLRRRAFGRFVFDDVVACLGRYGMSLETARPRFPYCRYTVIRRTRGGYRWKMPFRELNEVVGFLQSYVAPDVPPVSPLPGPAATAMVDVPISDEQLASGAPHPGWPSPEVRAVYVRRQRRRRYRA